MLGPVIHKQRRGLNPRMIDFMISWSSISMDFMIYLAFIERYVRSFLATMLLVRVGGALQVKKKVVSKEHVQMPHEQSLAIWASVKELSQCKCNVIKYTSPTDPIGYRWQKPVNPSAFCSRSHPLTRGPVAASSLLYNRVESHRIKARDPFLGGDGWMESILYTWTWRIPQDSISISYGPYGLLLKRRKFTFFVDETKSPKILTPNISIYQRWPAMTRDSFLASCLHLCLLNLTVCLENDGSKTTLSF